MDSDAGEFKTAQEVKMSQFKRALIRAEGNISKASMMCNVSRDTAHRWIKKNKPLRLFVEDLKEQRRCGAFDDDGDVDD